MRTGPVCVLPGAGESGLEELYPAQSLPEQELRQTPQNKEQYCYLSLSRSYFISLFLLALSLSSTILHFSPRFYRFLDCMSIQSNALCSIKDIYLVKVLSTNTTG